MRHHIEIKNYGENKDQGLNKTQTNLIQGALNWRSKEAHQIKKKASKVFMLSCEEVVNDKLMKDI